MADSPIMLWIDFDRGPGIGLQSLAVISCMAISRLADFVLNRIGRSQPLSQLTLLDAWDNLPSFEQYLQELTLSSWFVLPFLRL